MRSSQLCELVRFFAEGAGRNRGARRAARRGGVDNAIASQRLEGPEVDAETIEQLRDYAEGDGYRRGIARQGCRRSVTLRSTPSYEFYSVRLYLWENSNAKHLTWLSPAAAK